MLPAGGIGGVGSGCPAESARWQRLANGAMRLLASKPKMCQGSASRARASGTLLKISSELHQLTPASMYTFRGVEHAGTLDRATASSSDAANNIIFESEV